MERKLLIIGILLAAASPSLGTVGHGAPRQLTGTAPQAADKELTVLDKQLAVLSVANVRLEAAAPVDAEPATTLKFDLVNTTQQRLTEVVVEISIADKPSSEPAPTTTRILVRPFRLQGDVILEPGYSVGFEVLLRRLSADCECAPSVRVVSIRFLLD